MEKKLFGILDTRIKFILHMLFITGFVFLEFYLLNKYTTFTKTNPWIMALYLFAGLYVSDGIADKIFDI